MTNKTEKMTNRKALTYALENCDLPTDVAEKFTAMIAALDKKSTAERKPTAKQGENAEGDGFTCSDLIKVCPVCEGKSNQFVSALLRQAVLAGEVSKGTVKRRTYFAPVGVYAAADEGEGE